MSRLLVMLMLVAAAVCGQQTTTFQTIAANASAVPITVTLRNIGQDNHKLIVRVVDAPGQTCPQFFSGTETNALVQGSFDGSNWFGVSSNLGVIPPAPVDRALNGSGSFPYLRVSITNFDTLQCRLSAYYIGSIGYTQPNALDELDYRTIEIVEAAANLPNPHLTIAGTAGLSIVVYGIHIYNETGGQEVQLSNGSGLLYLDLKQLTADQNIDMQQTTAPYFRCPPGASLYVGILNSTNVSGYVRFRYE